MSLLQPSFQRRLESISLRGHPTFNSYWIPTFVGMTVVMSSNQARHPGKWKSSLRSIHRRAPRAPMKRCGALLTTLQIKRLAL